MKSLNGLEVIDIKKEHASIRLDEIRQISNVIQALENLVSQLDSVPGFDDMRLSAEHSLVLAEAELRKKIHAH